MLVAQRTSGGHRRITLQEAIRFIRAIGATVVRPDLLGLPELAAIDPDWLAGGSPDRLMHEAIEQGHAAEVRAMVQSLYLRGWTPAEIFDGPMRYALSEIGKLWLHAEWGIVVEHRATDICIQAVNQLRLLAPQRLPSAPIAIGAAAEHDPYMLPSLMAATVVGECGFLDVNLGNITPAVVLANAVQHYRAKLVWVSVSSTPDVDQAAESISKLADEVRPGGARVVIGGRMVAYLPANKLRGVEIAGSMAELGAFARAVLAEHQGTLPPLADKSADEQVECAEEDEPDDQ